MGSKSVTDVEVSDTETEIIESTETNKNDNRTFTVQNGEKQIVVTAWGLDDNQIWQIEDTQVIAPRESNVLIVGPSHAPRVKLTGRTVTQSDISIVDATLIWSD
jgi:hypothetical protein